MHTQESGKGMKKLRNNKIRKLLAFMVALALMVSCMPSAYTISASEAFGDGTEDIFTDGEITSEPAAEESTPDVSSADQEKTEQAQQSTLTYENDSVKVTAEALEDGALPQNTALKADSVNENSSVSYDTVSQKLSAVATDKGSSLRGFFAYDVYFVDGDGNRVEPNGRVRVTFEYKTPAAPELTDAASTSVTVEKLHYNSSTGDTDVNTLQANEDLKVLNVNEGKQIQTLQVETGNAAVFAVMWDSPETADVEAEAVSGNGDEVPIASEELTDGVDISDEPEQDAAETPAAENPEVTPDAEPSEAPAENPDAEPTEAPAEDPDVVEEPAEDIASPEDVPAADENGETSLIEVLGDDTNLRVSPSIEAEVLATVNAGTQLTLLDTVTAEDGATWYKVSWEGTEAYIRSDMAQVVDSSDEAEEPEDVQAEEIQPEITRYDYKSDEVNVKVTLTDPADLPDNAELSVTPVELSQEAEDQITEEAIKEKKAIEKIHSYDIKFLVDGEEVQPGATVKVEVSLPDIKSGQDADVYHVDADDNVENMDGSVNKKGNIEFDTTHFSTYVIVKKGNEAVKVTIKHYDDSNPKSPVKIYSDDKVDFEVGKSGRIDNYVKATNWTVEKVVVGDNTYTQEVDYSEIEVVRDTLVKVYYLPKNMTTKGNVKFYDYTVNAGLDQSGKQRSINEENSYAESDRADACKLMVGNNDDGKIPYRYYAPADNGKEGNYWTGKKNPSAATGLLTSISDNGKGSPVFKYADPGFFTDSDITFTVKDGTRYLRQYLDKYKLVFAQNGDTYTLSEVQNESGTRVSGVGADFFPLDGIIKSYEEGKKTKVESQVSYTDTTPHNYYFGMRYDVEFSIGDYVGPLKYDFTGDDDLWVALDGNRVLDLGGIHDALSGSVDIWKELGITDKENLSEERKNAKHRLTVLYMERGAGVSNCSMSFTLPNARIVNTTKEPLATLNFTKVDSGNQVLAGAKFTLVNNDTHETITATSGPDGEVSFVGLAKGEYTLTETSAPVNYVSDKTAYRVSVTSEGNTAVAHIYNDKNEVVEQIVNYTEKEEAEKNLTSNKTVKVIDENARKFQIDLSAEVTGREAGTETKGASVVLVMDSSDSMSGSRLSGIKSAAIEFVNTLRSASPSSEVSVIWYSGDEGRSGTTASKFYKLDEDNDYKALVGENGTIKNRSASGGTPMGDALSVANNKLADAESDNKKYVIFFTDGLPGYYPKSYTNNYYYYYNCWVAKNAKSAAENIKQRNAELYTISYLLNSNEMLSWNPNDAGGGNSRYNHYGHEEEISGSTFLRDYIASDTNHAFDSNNTENLKTTFKNLAGKIGSLYSIQPEEIVDVIDSRFELTPESEAELSKNENIRVDKKSDGTTTITWKNEAAKIGNKDAEKEEDRGWKASFVIKAKDDFIGGNMVPTNGAKSGIYLTKDPERVKKFPQPSVNVKLLSLKLDSKEVTVFKGEKINSQNFRDELASTFNVVDLKGNPTLKAVLPKDGDIVKLPELSNEQIDSLNSGKEVTIGGNQGNQKYEYQYPDSNSNEPVGYFTYTYKPVKNPNVNQHTATTVGKEVESYELVVKYYPYSTNERMALVSSSISEPEKTLHSNKTTDNKNLINKVPIGGTEVSKELSANGTYKVNVIAGQIQITKILEKPAKKGATFKFKIYKDGDVVETVTATVKAGATEAKFTVDGKESTIITVAELASGDYTVKEENLSGYKLEEAKNAEDVTNCKVATNNNDITFSIGTYTTQSGNAKAVDAEELKELKTENGDAYATYKGPGCVGKVDYTNKEIVADVDFVKVDSKNHGTKIQGAEFALYKAEVNDESTWSRNGEAIATARSANGGEFRFTDLAPGKYLMVETKATSEYALPTNPWKITVEENGKVTVKKNDGITEVGSSENKYLIENTKLYSLPNSGGPGTYGFTISGVAILATALLLFINNKRREEEAKRS